MQQLLAAVRQAAPGTLWSQGVQLVRADAVMLAQGASIDTDEVDLQVRPRTGNTVAHVTLWPDEAEWSCDCDSTADACIHVAAAVIALGQARQGRLDLGASTASQVHLTYHFFRTPGGLTFERMVTGDGTQTPLAVPLAVRLKAAGPPLLTHPHDSVIDTLVAHRPQLGQVPLGRALLGRILQVLEGCANVFLDHQPVRVAHVVSPHALHVSRRQHGGVLLQLRPTPHLSEIFANGAVRMGDSLSALKEDATTAKEKELWKPGEVVEEELVPRLMGTTIPEVQRRMEVVWHDLVAPTLDISLTPAIHIELEGEGAETMRALGTVVYGHPPAARVVMGELRVMGARMPRRNRPQEDALEGRLKDTLHLDTGRAMRFSGAEAAHWLHRAQEICRQAGWHLKASQDVLRRWAIGPSVTPRLGPEDDGSLLDFIQESTHKTVSGAAVMVAWENRESLVPLLEGGFAPLPQGWLEKHAHAVRLLLDGRAQMQTERDALGPKGLPGWARGALVELKQATGQNNDGDMPVAHKPKTLPPIPLALPEGVSLRPYQNEGIAWLRARAEAGVGALLADDMGLGKTVQTLAVLHGRSLVVAPTSVVFNWAAEAVRFRPDLKVSTYYGAQRQIDADADLILTTYGVLRLDHAVLGQTSWDCIVLDEAQRIKNPDSQVAQAAFALHAAWRIALSGTPVENRSDELWSLMNFLNRGLLKDQSTFAQTFAQPIAAGNIEAQNDLRGRIRPCLLRRTKREVLSSLPPRSEVVLRCRLNAEERAAYNAIAAATQKDVVARLSAGGSVMKALEALLRLRQAACHRGLLPGMHASSSSKVDLLLEKLSEAIADGHRALVFSQWTSLLDRIEPHLRAAKHAYLRLDGGTADRQSVVERFVADDGPPVLLASLKAGGVGLNLTAADHVFLLDPWWNPAAEDQAADRAHRLGQTRPVMIHRLVAIDTVEEKILALQAHKRAIAEALLGGESPDAQLGRQELLDLLAG